MRKEQSIVRLRSEGITYDPFCFVLQRFAPGSNEWFVSAPTAGSAAIRTAYSKRPVAGLSGRQANTNPGKLFPQVSEVENKTVFIPAELIQRPTISRAKAEPTGE